METQVELLRSDEVALRVISKLNLSHDPRFIGEESRSALGSLLYRFAPGYFAKSAPSEEERQSLVLDQFDKSLNCNSDWRNLRNRNRLRIKISQISPPK